MASQTTMNDQPPAYTEIPVDGNVTVEEGIGVSTIRRTGIQSTRSDQHGTSTASSGTPVANSQRPASSTSNSSNAGRHDPFVARLSRREEDENIRPPRRSQQQPQHHYQQPQYQNSSTHSFSSSQNYPPSQPHPAHQFHPQQRPTFHQQPPPTPQAPSHLQYPPNFWCPKCHNTGIKIHKGTSCQDCFERFGKRTQVTYLPSGTRPVFNLPPRVVRPGDPSIGGFLCGRCRGRGLIRELGLFESQCPVCRGVGRVF